MSTTPEEPTAAEEQAPPEEQPLPPQTPAAALSELADVLDKLVPPDSIEITDIEGNVHKKPSVLPARRQIKIFRIFKDILESDMAQGYLIGASAGSIASMVIDMASDEEVAEKLGEAFTIAFPGLYDDPLDMLPLEELVGSLVPFCLRFLTKAAKGLKAIT